MRKPERTIEQFETFLQQSIPHADVIAGENLIEVRPKESWICDFCSIPLTGKPRSFDVPDLVLGKDIVAGRMMTQKSLGAWAACPSCATFVLRDDDEGLAKHCLVVYEKTIHGLPRNLLATEIKKSHSAFWNAYRARPKT